MSRTPDPSSLRQTALARGLHPNTLRARLRAGWSLDRALTTPADRRGTRGSPRKPRTPGITAKARRAGLPPDTVIQRIRRGWSRRRALTEAVHTKRRA